jgi:DNA-binding MarR family transcriptional regulator
MDGRKICQYIYLIEDAGETIGAATSERNHKMPSPNALKTTGVRPKSATVDEINNRLFFRLFQTANIYQTQAVRELNISAVQGAVLGALSREPKAGMPFSSLYTYLAVSRQNLDAVLKGLERNDYVERTEAKGDRRTKIVTLTPVGAKAWNELLELTFEFYRQGTNGVSQAEAVACAETLAKIGRALKSANLGDSTIPGRKGGSNRRR